MKAIKLSIAALAVVFTLGVTNAQDGAGIQAGYSTETAVQGDNSSTIKGFHVGPTFEMSVQGPISLQYGILYNYLTASGSFYGITGTETKHTLDVPVRIAATFPLTNNGLSAFVFGGPNFYFGIADNIKVSGYGVSSTTDLYGNDEDGKYPRFDIQLGVGAGLKYNNVGVKAGYDWGMFNREKDADPAVKANTLKISLFFEF